MAGQHLSVQPSPLAHVLQVSVDQGRGSRCPVSLGVEAGCRGGGEWHINLGGGFLLIASILHILPLWMGAYEYTCYFSISPPFTSQLMGSVKPGSKAPQPCQVPAACPPSQNFWVALLSITS